MWRCDELAYTINNATEYEARYPDCVNGSSASLVVAAQFNTIEGTASTLREAFGGSIWLAIAINAAVVEIYLSRQARLFGMRADMKPID